MSGFNISGKSSQFNLSSLTEMAGKLGNNDKIRGQKNIFGTKTLYQKVKSEGTFKVKDREEKREMAVSFIKTSLANTLKSLNLPQNHHTRLEKAFENIVSRHTLGTEITGSDLKSITHEANLRLANDFRTLNSTTTFNESRARKSGIPFGGTPISHKGVREVCQSIYRWKDRDFTLTVSNGNDRRVLFTPVPPEQRKDFDTSGMVHNVLTEINDIMGNPNADITQKHHELSQFSPSNEGGKEIDPFTKIDAKENDKIVSTRYERKENNVNTDVHILKFTTKNLTAWATEPLIKQLEGTGFTIGKGPNAVDQFDSCHIEVKQNGAFDVTSKLSLDVRSLQKIDDHQSKVGSLLVTVTSHVSANGETDIEVNLSDLNFDNQKISYENQSEIFQALKQKLAGGA